MIFTALTLMEIIQIDGVATILSALIGFTGVSVTLLATARTRDRADAARREAGVLALLGALTGELKSNRSLLSPYFSILDAAIDDDNALGLRKIKFGATLTTGIFDESIGNIGQLHSSTVEKVASAYSHLKMLETFLERVVTRHASVVSPGSDVRSPVAQIEFRNPREVRSLHSNLKECLDAVSDAIDALEVALEPAAPDWR